MKIQNAMISARAKSIDVSGIRKVFALAGSLQNPIDLSIGQPDFPAFDELTANAKQAIDDGANRYVPTQGNPGLREVLAKQHGVGEGFDVCITSGVTGGLALSFLTVLDVGDEVLIPDPYFVVYKELANLFGVHVRCYDTYPDFKATVERIEAALTTRTKAVVLNSPANPTGVSISQDELDAISALCKARGIFLLYDEIYDAFCFDDPHPKLKLESHTLLLNGFSKTYGIPGWRVGYLIAADELIQAMSTVQQYTFVCANSVAQEALSKMPAVDFSELLEGYRTRRDYICSELSEYYEFVRPGGAFYLFPEVPKIAGKQVDALQFLERCIAKELLIVPGNAFSARSTHFRISFSAPMEVLERGITVLKQLAGA